MQSQTPRAPITLTDLPPELLDRVVDFLPTAASVSGLSKANRSLHGFVEKDGWKTFSRHHFPSLALAEIRFPNGTARTLTSLSRAWDRRAIIAKCIRPQGAYTAFPGDKKSGKLSLHDSQTMGFTPYLDVYEDVGSTWQERHETLSYSAGAVVILGHKTSKGHKAKSEWLTYRPLTASDGADDITTLHLMRPDGSPSSAERYRLVTGTAKGNLQLLKLPKSGTDSRDVDITYFVTQGKPVRTSSMLHRTDESPLLAACLGDSHIALYKVDPEQPKIVPSSLIDLKPSFDLAGIIRRQPRTWSTTILSHTHLAAGVGPARHAIHVHSIDASGLSKEPLRTFKLACDSSETDPIASLGSVYTLVPLPSCAGSSGDGKVFLSGAYDGVVRLHDMRSHREAEQMYSDSCDQGAIYSILPRGHESFIAGSRSHQMIKFFDLRLGAKQYHFPAAGGASEGSTTEARDIDGANVFLRTDRRKEYSWATGRQQHWRRPKQETSVYSLASSSALSPYVYAGVEGEVVSLAFSEACDPRPDAAHFAPWTASIKAKIPEAAPHEVLNLAMYERNQSMELVHQYPMTDMLLPSHARPQHSPDLDARWAAS